jgi:5'-nucleotidase
VDERDAHGSRHCMTRAAAWVALRMPGGKEPAPSTHDCGARTPGRRIEARMRILISNDDGIYSPGLVALAKAAASFGDVRIVAPAVEQSSMAQAITASRPLRMRHVALPGWDAAYSVDGTPSDCVALGVFTWGNVDLVFSGINLGLNVGNAMWHSGTLAAAKQAALLGVRGIAFSAPAIEGVTEYDPIRPWLERVIGDLIGRPELCLVNVNFPPVPRRIDWTRQSVRHYEGTVVPSRDPLGRAIYWFAPSPLGAPEAGTDRHAVEGGAVSITPLRLDLTDEATLRSALAHAAE